MTPPSTETPHPLAARLIAALREQPLDAPVIEVGTGSGRNTRALVAAGIPLVGVPERTPYTQLPGGSAHYGAALATHAYLHGATAKLRLGLAELRRVLRPGGRAYLTVGSIRDARYGLGIPLDERTFAPGEGDETGIPHAYFDRDGVLELLNGFELVALDEVDADATVGSWAHPDGSDGRVHWFVEATRT
jgi:SAM-dependent methyltransferase